MTEFIAKAVYHGPTDSKGARISVQWHNNRRTIPIDHGWRTDNVMREAIAELFRLDTESVQWGGIPGYYIVRMPEFPGKDWSA